MDMLGDIAAFHDKFQLSERGAPRFLDRSLTNFRIACLREEIQEFEDAVACNDLASAFDALIDLAYFTLGTARIMNLPFDEGWQRVHAANMRKVRAERSSDSKRGSTFDVVKPADWAPPVLDDLVDS